MKCSIPVVFGTAMLQPRPARQNPVLPARHTFLQPADSLEIHFGHNKRVAKAEIERPLADPHRVKIFTGRSNTRLAREVAQYLGMELSSIWLKNHRSSETHVELKE